MQIGKLAFNHPQEHTQTQPRAGGVAPKGLSWCATASSQALISNDSAEGSSWIVINCRKTDSEGVEPGQYSQAEAFGEPHRAGSSIAFSTTQINAIYLN